jgi:hypothetical protein
MKLNTEMLIINILLLIFVQDIQYFAFEFRKLAQVPETKIGIFLQIFVILFQLFDRETLNNEIWHLTTSNWYQHILHFLL